MSPIKNITQLSRICDQLTRLPLGASLRSLLSVSLALCLMDRDFITEKIECQAVYKESEDRSLNLNSSISNSAFSWSVRLSLPRDISMSRLTTSPDIPASRIAL